MKVIKLTNSTLETLSTINQKFVTQWQGESSIEKYSWHSSLKNDVNMENDYFLIFIDCYMLNVKYIICCFKIINTKINLPPESIGQILMNKNTLSISHISDLSSTPRMQVTASNFQIFEVENCSDESWLNISPTDILLLQNCI